MLGEQVVEELGGRFYAGHQEMIAGAGARDVEQVALGGVDLFEFGLIADPLDSSSRLRMPTNCLTSDRHIRSFATPSPSARRKQLYDATFSIQMRRLANDSQPQQFWHSRPNRGGTPMGSPA